MKTICFLVLIGVVLREGVTEDTKSVRGSTEGITTEIKAVTGSSEGVTEETMSVEGSVAGVAEETSTAGVNINIDDVNSTRNKFNSTTNSNLPAPRIYGIGNCFNDDDRIILWLPVKSAEPILGYKARVWEVGNTGKKKTVSKTINGQRVLVEENVVPKLHDYSTLHSLQEYVLVGSRLVLSSLQRGVRYHVMVLAYNENGDGPLSQPFRFLLPKTADT